MAVRLTAGGVSASVDPEAGGRLSSLVVGGRERLITDPDPASALPAVSWGSFAMLPWVGRLRDGHLSWRGTTAELRRNFGAHSIHGLAFDRPWDVLAVDGQSIELGCPLGPAIGWPFEGEARQSVVLATDALELRVEVRAATPMPIAVGWHPWFRRHEAEPISVTVPAPTVLDTTDDLIPTGTVSPVAGPTDLRRPADLADRQLDHAYVGVAGPCIVAWTDLELVIEASPLRSVVVYTTPRSVCVEPQTAWPDAIRIDEAGVDAGLVALEGGDWFVARTRWSWRERSGDRERP